jgi:hypothetical protein
MLEMNEDFAYEPLVWHNDMQSYNTSRVTQRYHRWQTRVGIRMHRGMQFRYKEVDKRGFGVDAVDDDIIHANDQVLFIPDKAFLCGCGTLNNRRYILRAYLYFMPVCITSLCAHATYSF